MKKPFFILSILGAAWAITAGPLHAQTATPTFTSSPTASPTPCCQSYALPTPITGLGGPFGMAVNDSNGNIYVADAGSTKLLRVYDGSTGAPVTSIGSWTASGIPQTFAWPNDVVIDKNWNIYVSDGNRGEVDVFNGSTYAYITSIGTGVIGYCRGVMVDNQGVTTSVYISGQNNNVYRFDSEGMSFPATASVTFGGSGVLNVPNEIVKMGNAVLVGDDGGNIVSFALPHYTSTTVNPGIGSIKSLRMDLAGLLYAGTFSGANKFPSGPSSIPSLCPLPNSTWGLAVNATGNIFMDEQGTGSVALLQGCVTEPVLTPTPTLTPAPSYQGSNPPGQGQCYIFPSPVKGDQASVAYFMAESGTLTLKIWNRIGEMAAQVTDHRPAGVQATSFNVSGFAPGVYFFAVKLDYDSGRSEKPQTGKFAVIR